MSNSASGSGLKARPKPRPRPRPTAVAPPPPSAPAVSSPTETPPSPTAQWQKEVDDEDALFMRNRSRTTKTWKQLEELDKLATRYSATDVSSDEGELLSSQQSRKGKKKPIKAVSLPKWTRSDDIIRMLSEDRDDDALQEIENTPKGKRSEQSPLKRKRNRNRSKSITPPPAIPIHQIQNIRDIVRQTLDMAPRAPSPTIIIDDSNETIELDPELAEIAQAVRNQSYQSQSFTAEPAGGPEAVTIRVRWQPHPLNQAGQPMIWAFKMKRHDPFRLIFEEIADMAAILSEDLIVCFRNNRLFPSATPHSIKIWAEADLDAYNRTTYDYIRTQRHKSPVAPEQGNQPDHDDTSLHSLDGGPAADSDAESVGGEKFKLTLRSAVSTITLTVRPTTTCGAIVNAFLKSAGLTAKYAATPRKNGSAGPRLQIDGEKMNPAEPIGNAGLEDGDCVDVVGL